MLKTHKLSALLVAVLALSGCAIADAQPDTATMKPFGNGVDAAVGDLLVQDTTVVMHDDGTAVLTLTAINNGDATDELVGVTVDGAEANFSPSATINPNGGTLRIGFNSDYFAEVTGSSVKPGTHVDVTYTFKKAGSLTVNALVVEPLGEYSLVTPQPADAESL
ncbi:MAG: hypothetical protein RL038_917 [Actinomycetota bacterium]|jgi:copper(I)-binding protein